MFSGRTQVAGPTARALAPTGTEKITTHHSLPASGSRNASQDRMRSNGGRSIHSGPLSAPIEGLPYADKTRPLLCKKTLRMLNTKTPWVVLSRRSF